MRLNPLRSFVALLPLALAACGGAGGGGGSDDWYYHFACNGDSQCLATNPLGTASGTINEGPVESNCTSLQLFRTKFWGPSSWDACDHNPTFTIPGPTITAVAPTAAVAGTQITITGTNFPSTPAGVTFDIGGVAVPTTSGFSVTPTTVTLTIPNVPSMTGPITVHTPAGSVTSATSVTILNHLYAVAWSGSRFLAVGANASALTSSDGASWTAQATGANPLLVQLQSAAWAGGRFLAGGTNGRILSSPDGVAWSVPATGLGMMTFDSLAWSSTRYVAAGTGGYVATSTDGSSWTSQLLAADIYGGVVWANGQFVMVGHGAFTSPDGLTWTTRYTQGTSLNAVAWSGTTFAAVGDNGAVVTSPDGVTWTPQTSGTAAQLRGVAWFKGRFVAVGANGTILTSPDGVAWTARSSGLSVTLNGIAGSPSTAVAVGNAGVTAWSSDGLSWTSPLPPPPTGVTGTKVSTTQIDLTWTPVAGATSYVVYVGRANTVSKTLFDQRVAASGTSASLTGLAAGYQYVVVTAVNGYGEGAPSAVTTLCAGMYLCGG